MPTLNAQSTVPHAYRPDIDGLRAFAVLAVVAFHFGILPMGYLGVDVFFVISGYLITNIIVREAREGRFSILNFYLRRTRRILPLVAFICVVALALGFAYMLPDDLENLAQSIVATIAFANNILQAITVGNYWDVFNEFKPLMHTWSLGVEEQYYLIYPFLFLALGGKRLRWLTPILIVLTLVSLALYLAPFPPSMKFYYLPFRFFELSIGGLLAVQTGGVAKRTVWAPLALILTVLLMAIPLPFLPAEGQLLLLVAATVWVLAAQNGAHPLTAGILQNPICVWVGKVSFSLYMWHQLVLAFYRYLNGAHIDLATGLGLFALMVALSTFTYYLIEQPCRNRHQVKTPVLLATLVIIFALTGGTAFWLYLRAGVWRDVPELDITTEHIQRGMHGAYNDRVRQFNHPFPETEQIKVLLVGNSLARDWANVLLESPYSDQFALRYIEHSDPARLIETAKQADVIFVADVPNLLNQLGPDAAKVTFIGYKNFGSNNGQFYNYRGEDYLDQRAVVDRDLYKFHLWAMEQWGDHYLDLLAVLMDEQGRVAVFTPEGKFISQDTRHLTQAGADYLAEQMDKDIRRLLGLDK